MFNAGKCRQNRSEMASRSSSSVTAWFGNEPLEDVVNTVCRVVGAQCTIGETVEVDQ